MAKAWTFWGLEANKCEMVFLNAASPWDMAGPSLSAHRQLGEFFRTLILQDKFCDSVNLKDA